MTKFNIFLLGIVIGFCFTFNESPVIDRAPAAPAVYDPAPEFWGDSDYA